MTWKRHIRNLLGPGLSQRLTRQVNDWRARRHDGSLVELATHFGTDKWNTHWYAQHYDRHFGALRDRPILIMEIGIGGYDDPEEGGESLRAWKWYFRRGRVVGIDLYDKSPHREDRIRTFQGSQDDRAFLERVVAEVGRPDIIVDDGSHLNHHVLATFDVLFPLLADDGWYVVEDTQSSYWPTWGGDLSRDSPATTSAGFLARLTHGLNYTELAVPGYVPTYYDTHIVAMHFYHNLIFVQKGSNDEKSNMVTNGIVRT